MNQMIVGLAERQFPSPPRPDPILLDHERRRLGAEGRHGDGGLARRGERQLQP